MQLEDVTRSARLVLGILLQQHDYRPTPTVLLMNVLPEQSLLNHLAYLESLTEHCTLLKVRKMHHSRFDG